MRRRKRSRVDPSGPRALLSWLLSLPQRATFTSVALSTLLVITALAIGAVHAPVLLVVAALTSAAILVLAPRAKRYPMPALLASGIALFCLFQTIPWPIDWLAHIAPRNEEVWRESLALVSPAAPEWAPISIDPGATRTEALKWFFYSGLLFLASWVTERRGNHLVMAIVFWVSLGVAAVTLLHGTLGAEKLYGFYERSFTDDQWALSPFVNANNFASNMNLGAILGIALLSRRHQRSKVLSGSIWLGIALMAALCLTSGSRGGTGSLLVGLCACATIYVIRSANPGHRRLREVMLIGCGVSLAVVLLVLSGPGERAFAGLDDDSLAKLRMIKWAAPLISDHFWLGVGAGAFETGFLPYQVPGHHEIWTHPENFLLGWAAELGIPATLVILIIVGLAIRRTTKRRLRTHEMMAWVAASIWLLQNLVDLATTVPGAFAPLLCLFGSLLEPHERCAAVPHKAAPLPPRAAGAAGSVLCALLLVNPDPSADAERKSIAELARTASGGDLSAEKFHRELGAAIRRHPGDAFLLRMGAVGIPANKDDRSAALRWLGRSLERNMVSGRTHLLLAMELARTGALSQALMELRLSVQHSPELASIAAQHAVAWTQSEPLLRRTVPAGLSGATMLTELAQNISPDPHNRLRRVFLHEAIARDPGKTRPRLMYLEDAVARWRLQPNACDAPCAKEVHALLAGLTKPAVGEDVQAVRVLELGAEVRALAGDPKGAVESLLTDCPRSRQSCLSFAVLLSESYKLSLERPVEYLLSASCPGSDTCPSAHRTLSNLYARKANWNGAAVHARTAADHSNSPEDYLLAAQMAVRAQRPGLARQALHNLATATPAASPEQLKSADELQKALPVDYGAPGVLGPAP